MVHIWGLVSESLLGTKFKFEILKFQHKIMLEIQIV